MLEGRDLASVDQAIPFVAVLADRLSGNTDRALHTEVTVKYCDMVSYMTRLFACPGFTDEEMVELSLKK